MAKSAKEKKEREEKERIAKLEKRYLHGVDLMDLGFLPRQLAVRERAPKTRFEESLLAHMRGENLLRLGTIEDINETPEANALIAFMQAKTQVNTGVDFWIDLNRDIVIHEKSSLPKAEYAKAIEETYLYKMRNQNRAFSSSVLDTSLAQYKTDGANEFSLGVKRLVEGADENLMGSLVDNIALVPIIQVRGKATIGKIYFTDWQKVRPGSAKTEQNRKFWKGSEPWIHFLPIHKSGGWSFEPPTDEEMDMKEIADNDETVIEETENGDNEIENENS